MPHGFIICYGGGNFPVVGLVHIAVIVTVLDRGVERRRAGRMERTWWMVWKGDGKRRERRGEADGQSLDQEVSSSTLEDYIRGKER